MFTKCIFPRYSCITYCYLSRNYCGISTAKNKNKSGKLLKRYNEENKSLFGKLAETAGQKRDRKRRESTKRSDNANNTVEKSDTSHPSEKELSSELWWWKNSSTKVIQVGSNVEDPQYYKQNHRSDDFITDSIEDTELLNTKDTICDQTVNFPLSDIKLPEIIVRNITTFPLENLSKNISDEWVQSSDILSIPLRTQSDTQPHDLCYPSVTRILNTTMSDSARAALQKWKDGLVKNLGEEGFLKYQKELLDNGKLFHSTVQRFLSGIPESKLIVEEAVKGCWDSLNSVLPNISNIRVLESHVIHTQLFYHGIIDCVAMYKGKPIIIEWKKSDKQKPILQNTYDAPLQLAAYLGALNFDPNYDFKVSEGMVVVAYTNGSPAHVHRMSLSECSKYWKMWLKRLQVYWKIIDGQDNEKISLRSV